MSVTEEIKSRLDIVDVVSGYLPLRRSGSSYTGFCPFHDNTRTPSFAVFPSSQTWRCFGACAEGGDVFSFVMKKEGWDFKEALAQLAQRAGVTLETRKVDPVRKAAEDRLTDLLETAADYFHQLLLHAPQGEGARTYLDRRGLTAETLETFKVGFALDSWDAGHSHFSAQGYSDDELLRAGLLTVNEERDSRYDRFRNRLMIPIRDVTGRTVGFGARTLDPDGVPKYLNSPQTAVFDKGHLLFGLDFARRHVREARQVVIVEGYMDVMQAWQAGYKNVVAQMGTALTEAQLRLAKRYAKRFVIALDPDAAGAAATLRSLEVARGVLDREPEIAFDARGLVQTEGRLQADLRVVTLPPGEDPDQLIRRDPAEWARLIEQAKPLVAYVIDVATGGLDLNDPKAKSDAALQLLPVISDVADPVQREHYRQHLARVLKVDERVLAQVSARSLRRERAPGPARPAVGPPETPPDAPPSGPAGVLAGGLVAAMRGRAVNASGRRDNLLRECLRYPHIIGRVNQRLQEQKLAPISEEDFTAPEDRALWRHLLRLAPRWSVVTSEELWDSLDDEILRERVQSLLAHPATAESQIDSLPDSVIPSILDWRFERARSLQLEVQHLYREAEVNGDRDMMALYAQQLTDVTTQTRLFGKAMQRKHGFERRGNGA